MNAIVACNHGVYAGVMTDHREIELTCLHVPRADDTVLVTGKEKDTGEAEASRYAISRRTLCFAIRNYLLLGFKRTLSPILFFKVYWGFRNRRSIGFFSVPPIDLLLLKFHCFLNGDLLILLFLLVDSIAH